MDIRPIDANALRQHKKMLVERMDGYDIAYAAVPMYKVDELPTISLNTLRDEIYQDAVAHGLWEIEDEVSKNRMLLGEETGYMSALTFTCAQKIKDECYELVMALTEDLFSEELADVIIMSMSVAGRLGIDIDAAIRRKMEINKKRPWKHGKE